MTRLNVRWRLTLWYGSVLTAIVIAFGLLIYMMMQRHLMVRTDFELDEELTELMLEVELAANESELRHHLEQRFYQHASFDFRVARRDGDFEFRSSRLPGISLPETAEAETGERASSESRVAPEMGQFRVVGREVRTPKGHYLVQATMPLQTNEIELTALLTTLLAAGPLAIGAAIAGGYWLAKQSLSPVDRMATTAETITATRLDARIAVINPHDELGHLAHTFNAMLDRLERSVNEQRRFTADAAHELRTPLAVMQTEAEVALRSPRAAEDYRRVVEITLVEIKRLSRLADQLLSLSRHDWGVPQHNEELPLSAIIADACDQVQTTASAKGIRIERDIVDDLTVEGNDIQLSRLLTNLLDNAIKFTPRGGRIGVTSEEQGSNVVVQVSDNGAGIPPSDLPHVFERFYRSDPSRSRETGGAGLGLAISKAIVEAHAGSIEIQSVLDEGTKVSVSLPKNGPARRA